MPGPTSARPRGARRLCVNRIQIDPGRWSTPAHIESAEEEVFYVLGGSGWSWQQLGAAGEVRMYAVSAGDCIVHFRGRERHTLLAGDARRDRVRQQAPDAVRVPSSCEGRLARRDVGRRRRRGLAVAARGGRRRDGPRRAVSRTAAEHQASGRGSAGLGRAGVPTRFGCGAQQAGLNLVRLPPGGEGAPPHCHSAEDEFFVVLDGEGTLHVDPTPTKVEFGGQSEEHPVGRGSVASFAAGANVCHSLRAGGAGLTFLAYSTRQPHDVIYYLRRNALFFKGLGVMIPIEHVGSLEP